MPKVVDHELYREELLTRSMPLFVTQGVDGVTMRELAVALSVSTGTLYHYFTTKENLFASMVKNYVAKDAEEILALTEANRGVDDLVRYVTSKENHFINLILLALDVKRHHSDSEELTHLLDESWNSYRDVLARFFENEESQNAGEAFLSFFVGALFLKSTRTSETNWSSLFDGLGQISSILIPLNQG